MTMFLSGCCALDKFGQNKLYFKKAAWNYEEAQQTSSNVAHACWQPHPVSTHQLREAAADIRRLVVSGTTASTVEWVTYAGSTPRWGEKPKEQKERYFRFRNNACYWQSFVTRKLSTVLSSWLLHAASWHLCGLHWEPMNALGLIRLTFRGFSCLLR